jgi:hypothetical protein
LNTLPKKIMVFLLMLEKAKGIGKVKAFRRSFRKYA